MLIILKTKLLCDFKVSQSDGAARGIYLIPNTTRTRWSPPIASHRRARATLRVPPASEKPDTADRCAPGL